MLFSSMIFLWVFLPILLGLYFIAKDKYRNIILLIFSIIFYSWGEPKYVVLMLLSILINYIYGLLIDKYNSKKKIILICAIITNLGLLGYFKYFNFFALNVNRLFNFEAIPVQDIALPIGISFYTFQIISYLIDLYRQEIKVQKNILNLALYISFFPQLIAGPIIKYHDIDKQISNRTVTLNKFAAGIRRFVYGLAKKVIVANSMGEIADYIYALNLDSINTPLIWVAAICYMIQIYYDFSGYSDMAIGLGKMFGFDINENFNLPYMSKSITEFWRRWHISLSTWFKEYLYIPLGGNRKGALRTYINLSIVFLATGLWHGAAWNFVAWGVYNGVFMLIERFKLKEILDKNKFKFINHIYLLFVVLIGWVLFRAPSLTYAIEYIKIMFSFDFSFVNIDADMIFNMKNLIIFIFAILFSGVIQEVVRKYNIKFEKIKVCENFVMLFLFLICIMMLISNTYNPFIYFRF